MRIKLERDLCEGNGMCEGYAPSVFELDENFELRVLNDQPGEELRDSVEQAVNACPKQALALIQD